MKRSRFTEDQIIGILKEHEAGVSVADLCRKHGVSDATVYKWKAKYGGMDVSANRRCRRSRICAGWQSCHGPISPGGRSTAPSAKASLKAGRGQ
jgi:hypothetical protein